MATPSSSGNYGAPSRVVGKTPKNLYVWFALICGVLIVLVNRQTLRPKSQPGPGQAAATFTPVYSTQPCEVGWDKEVQEPSGKQFILEFKEAGCFDGLYRIPVKGWQRWGYRRIGNDPDWWISLWFEGENQPTRVYRWYENAYLGRPLPAFHLQGKVGTKVLFYEKN